MGLLETSILQEGGGNGGGRTPIRREEGIDRQPSKRLYTVRLFGTNSLKEGAMWRGA
jgi:hypothetical protein